MAKKTIIHKKVAPGEIYGKLKVVSVEGGRAKVTCVCGRKMTVINGNLVSGTSKSCRRGRCHTHFKDIAGQTFGSLKVIELTGNSGKDGSTEWRCLCVCGKERCLSSTLLRRGKVKSCGCKSRYYNSINSIRLPEKVAHQRALLASNKRGANQRGLEFSLSQEEFDILTSKNCHYCGSVPKTISRIAATIRKYDNIYNGIDRMDNIQGYTKQNCITCCKRCNVAKRDTSYGEFVGWIEELTNHFSQHKDEIKSYCQK